MKNLYSNGPSMKGLIASVCLAFPMLTTNNAVAQAPPSYCNPSFSTIKPITNVTIGGVNNSNDGAGAASQNFTSQIVSANQGSSLPISVSAYNFSYGGGLPQYVSVLVDFNNDGIFTAEERFELGIAPPPPAGTGATTTFTGSIPVPNSALIGPTRMRVITNSSTYSADGCGGVDFEGQVEDYTFSIDAPLPVSLTRFQGQFRTNEQVQLQWSTSSENNNRGFEILRSLDGTNFEIIGFVSSKDVGTSSTVKEYTFFDNGVAATKALYKLNQVDFDGTSATSGILTVVRRNSESVDLAIEIYPNPVRNMLQIATGIAMSENAELVVMDVYGRKLIQQKMNSFKTEVNVSNLANGTYFVGVANNGNIKAIKFQKL